MQFSIPGSAVSFGEAPSAVEMPKAEVEPRDDFILLTLPSLLPLPSTKGAPHSRILVLFASHNLESRGSMHDVDLAKILLSLRQCRMGIIQTAQQLRYSYCAIVEGGTMLLSTPPNDDEDADTDSDDNGGEEEEEDECTDDEESHFQKDFLRSLKNKMFTPNTPPHLFENSDVSAGEASDGEAADGEEEDDSEIVGFLTSAQSAVSAPTPETENIDRSPVCDDVQQQQQSGQLLAAKAPPNLPEDIALNRVLLYDQLPRIQALDLH
ncbi:unnamed protein product [Dibothriocephalus latus]|uniref:protein-tyrosine-phosphatase n=1 Tax=Dibothriocephalus latus TaxID=60516 RepID=A0A3P7NQS9_DIBLA|nr:unnamed protein product [Dibothriocephalus latus]